MIAQLTGTLVSKKKNKIIVDVSGIGYEVNVSLSAFTELAAENSKIKILTYQHFRENGAELFGFVSEFEKELFLLLIGVPGIGPKTAMEILSNTSLAGFKRAIIAKDVKTISSIKGIGKKTAEKLIFELKDKIREFYIPDSGMPVSGVSFDEAIEALRTLGFTYIQAKESVDNVVGTMHANSSTQDVVREALKKLGR